MHAWIGEGCVDNRTTRIGFAFLLRCMKLWNNVYSNFNEDVMHVAFQACERDHIYLIVPVVLVPILSREYLYTAMLRTERWR
jgi:hypothetical protein